MAESSPIWFVNGASSGFGKAIAAEVLHRGHRVIATARKTSTMADLGKAGAFLLALDVTSDDDIVAAKVKEASAVYGGITHLVNCAGYQLEGMIEESSTQEVYDVFNTNVFGTLKVTRAVLPHMRETTSACQKVVANFGSTGSWTAWPSTGMYCSTKWAISGLTEGLAAELAPLGIKATVIEPGVFRTEVLALASNRRQAAAKCMPVYKEMRDAVHGFMNSMHDTQLGDVVKGARVIVDVLTTSGVAEGREIPLRLPLGPDSIDTVGGKCKDTLKLMDDWLDVIKSTDYDS